MSDTQITQNLETRPTSTQVVRIQFQPSLHHVARIKMYNIVMTKFQFNLLGKVKKSEITASAKVPWICCDCRQRLTNKASLTR